MTGLDTQLMDALSEDNYRQEERQTIDFQVSRNYRNFFTDPDKRTGFKHADFAAYIMKKYHVINLDDIMHTYNEGIYVSDELLVKRYMLREIPTLKLSQIRESVENIRINMPKKKHASANLIPVLNGIYDITTGRLYPYTPEYIVTSRINAKYDPDAECEIVDNALITIADNDFEVLQLFLEIIGYTLYKQNFLDKAFLLVGNGGNGKSTFMNMLSAFVGEENVSAVSLAGLSERFNVAELHHKLLNAGDDIPLQAIKDASNFKKLATGERVMAERKGQDPYFFRNYSKLVFSANDVPRWFENTDGIFDRIVIVPLNAQLRKNPNRDPFLEKKITTDEARSHLLNLGITQLKRLLKYNRFTIPAVSKQRMEQFKEENNPILTFLSEVDVEGEMIASSYIQYRDWCDVEGHKFPLTRNAFTKAITTQGFNRSKKRFDGHKNPQWYFTKLDVQE